MSRQKKKRNRKFMDYWQSYSDMMAALLLVFILIVFAVIQKLQTQQDEIAAKQAIVDKQKITIEKLGGDADGGTSQGYGKDGIKHDRLRVGKV